MRRRVWLKEVYNKKMFPTEQENPGAVCFTRDLSLIDGHGTGSSLLLERIVGALKLNWRHYNASLVNFYYLVGYPIPDANGKLQVIEIYASILGAEVVFIDEISRVRTDIHR